MKKRTLVTTSVVVMLILSLAPFYVPSSTACEGPDVEIWKDFVEDPLPSYSLKTEYHWDIEIGVWTSVNLRIARVYDRFGAELKMDNIKIDYEQDGTIDKTYTFTYPDYEEKYPTEDATVTIDEDGTTIGTYDLNWRGAFFGSSPYWFYIRWSGKTHKIHFLWYIGTLEADETITIIIGVSTDLNPGGKQEYTSTCEHCINSGAVLIAMWRDRCRCRCICRCICAKTEQLCVKVECEGPPPARLILDKFNDTNGNGVYDAGDIKITDWQIDVTDPYGGTTTYLTPKVVEITEFGTYTVTEELRDGWEQTAVEVDGTYEAPPTQTVTVVIDAGEEHSVLYGNREIPGPPPSKLIVEKFNDKNNNGVYDEGVDEMMTGWKIDVTDPDGLTASYSTPVNLDITKFGNYTVTEDLPGDWEQTALRVDGVYIAPTVEVTLDINEAETHNVLYGNRLPAPPPPPPVGITLRISPISVYAGGTVTFSWIIESPPEVTPDYAELYLRDPDGTIISLGTYTDFPTDFTGSYAWTSTTPTGLWRVYIVYHYTYYGRDYTVRAYGSFRVR